MSDMQTLAQAVISNPSIFSSEVIEAAHRAATGSHVKENGAPKLWKPEKGCAYWFADRSGRTTYDVWGGFKTDVERLAANNIFRTEEAAQHAAATFKIQNLVWRWKEENDPKVPQCGQSFFWAHWGFEGGRLTWYDNYTWGDGFGPFTTPEKTSQFIRDCKPQLDEYAHAMGWK